MISASFLVAYLFFWEDHNPYLVVGGMYAVIFEACLEVLWATSL